MAIYSPASVAAVNRGELMLPQTTQSQQKRPTLIGWIVVLFALFLLNRTSWGHMVIYWTLVVIAVYLIIANFQRIAPVLEKKEG